MTVDVYDDHIRFLGYHVPLDTSKLPPTTTDALVRELQEGPHADEDEIEEARKEGGDFERGRVLDIVETWLSKIEDAIAAKDAARFRKHIAGLREFVDAA